MWSSVLAGLAGTALSGALGGSGQAPNVPYTGQVQGNLIGETGGGNNLLGLGNQQTGAFDQFSPTATNQTNQYLNLLNQNPYTSSFDTAQLANATSGLNTAYGQGVSQLQQSLGSRGLGGDGSSGGMNSTMAGGLTALGASKAQTLGQTANQIAMNAIQQRYQNLGTAQGVASNYANQLYGQGVGATQAGGGLLNSAANGYLGLGQLQQGANEQYQQQLAGAGSLLGYGLGGVLGGGSGGASSILGGGLGGVLGGGSGGATSSQSPFGNLGYNFNLAR